MTHKPFVIHLWSLSTIFPTLTWPHPSGPSAPSTLVVSQGDAAVEVFLGVRTCFWSERNQSILRNQSISSYPVYPVSRRNATHVCTNSSRYTLVCYEISKCMEERSDGSIMQMCFSHLPEKYSASAICQKSTAPDCFGSFILYIYSFMTFYDGLFMLFSSLQRFFGLACHAQFFAAPLSLFPRPWCAVHEHQTLASSVLCTCQAPNHAAFAFCRSTSQWKVI
jgi:hypothetical protein